MKIVHIAPNAPYNDNWGYQDNLLPKYHKKDGHDVTLIITNRTLSDGHEVEIPPQDYVLDDGVRVIRLNRKQYRYRLLTSMCSKLEVYSYLRELQPDFIFYHGLSSTTIYDAVRFKKELNPSCIIVRDNHIDYNNCPKYGKIKQLIIRSFERYNVRRTMPFVSCVYGVTPWRKQYAEEYYLVPQSKTDLLIMGADDEKMDFSNKEYIRTQVRNEYNISENDFLVVTGGKIDLEKKIHLLMEACRKIENVKLLVFGNISEKMKEIFEFELSNNKHVIYIGWINSSDVYRYFYAADLVFFPGGHSVLWEQACASKVPCVFNGWTKMEHLNNGGNSDFIDNVSVDSIREKIIELKYTSKYYKMKRIAESDKTDIYLYSNIARKSLECVK